MVKITLIVIMVAAITYFHYTTSPDEHYRHLFYQEIYFLPLILAGFWFGLRGALATSFGITALYLPFIFMHWTGFSPQDFNRLMATAIFNIIAAILGMLKEREIKEQKRLREAERFAAMGKAMAGAAHDMKTPLIAIGGFSRLLKRRLFNAGCRDEDYYLEKLDIIVNETARLEKMVKEMLDFSRPLELDRSPADVDAMIRESLAVIESIADARRVSLRHSSSEGLPEVFLDAMRMKQVVINLVTNAVEASPEGEAVTVHSTVRRGKLIVDVTDCGCGIPREMREEVFYPFFTTKKEGTGLGLALAKKIVEAHDGSIEILDAVGNGLTFRVVIPTDHR